jgi:ABC-type transporter Mla MlaB component
MFSHLVVKGARKDDSRILLFGVAIFTHAEEMQSALGEALEGCHCLTIDVEGVEAFDVTFRVLLCSLHRRSQLVNKTILLQGGLPGREDDPAKYARVEGCLFKNASDLCTLWHSRAESGVRLPEGAERGECRVLLRKPHERP